MNLQNHYGGVLNTSISKTTNLSSILCSLTSQGTCIFLYKEQLAGKDGGMLTDTLQLVCLLSIQACRKSVHQAACVSAPSTAGCALSGIPS